MVSHSTETKPSLHTLRVDPIVPFNRLHAFLYSCAILALLYHHLTSVSILSSFLLLSDLILAFMWALSQAFRWQPISRQEFPELLSEHVDDKDLPALDVFICTADPQKEPPMSVVSTALSVMAFDYPADKLSVYVSDDGGSDLTLFAFIEAARFAKYWIPFCKENRLEQRSPDAYFESTEGGSSEEIEMMYRSMKEKVEYFVEKGGCLGNDLIDTSAEEYAVLNQWKGFTCRDHPAIIQVLLESGKHEDTKGNAMPNLVYVSREKSATSPHNFKAGALNALLRVSSAMTGASVVLTLDCDMFSNDPQTPRRALCYLLDPAMAAKLAYVQFPQRYRGINKNDIYGSEMKRMFRINARGIDGLRGPDYFGTGCFFSRRSFYGPPLTSPAGLSDPLEMLGSDRPTADGSLSSESVLRTAHDVASCTYELDHTEWGSMIGFRYGSLVEDFYTGYRMHCEGWKSVFCEPERPAFLADVPKNLNEVLSQRKRWCVGLLEVAFSRYSPLIFGTRKASLLVGMCYAYYAFEGSWCIPISIYGLLPQLALSYQIPLFPKVSDPWFYLYVYLFLASYCQDLLEFLDAGGTIQRWWNDQRIWMIRSVTSFSFGTAQFALNAMGFFAPGFNVTSKVIEEEQNTVYENGFLYFGMNSPFFMTLGTLAIVNLTSFALGMLKAARKEGGFSEMFVQLFLSGFGVANCWPIVEAMFVRRDGGRMPANVRNSSMLLAGLIYAIGYFLCTD